MQLVGIVRDENLESELTQKELISNSVAMRAEKSLVSPAICAMCLLADRRKLHICMKHIEREFEFSLCFSFFSQCWLRNPIEISPVVIGTELSLDKEKISLTSMTSRQLHRH